jgi:predicted aconitase with swiveling domain
MAILTGRIPLAGRISLKGKPLLPGSAKGAAVVSQQPISFWGGVDPLTGQVIDQRHDCYGANLAGKIFVIPAGKGSSTSSAVLLEGIRNGTAPAGLVLKKADPILALGAIVAEEMYQRFLPVVLVSEADFAMIQDGDQLSIALDGTIEIQLSKPDGNL